MSKFLTGKQSKNGNKTSSKEFNEFARIQGLEPSILRWLREAFQVFTVADLANLSVNRVFFHAAGEGKTDFSGSGRAFGSHRLRHLLLNKPLGKRLLLLWCLYNLGRWAGKRNKGPSLTS